MISAESKKPDGFLHRAFCSGDVLLSHNLSSHYHRGCSVSLPCSEWERVGPPRYYHQRGEEFSNGDFRISISTIAYRFRAVSGDHVSIVKEPSFNRRSPIENRKCHWFSEIYIQSVSKHARFQGFVLFWIIHFPLLLSGLATGQQGIGKVNDQAERVISIT